jgi:hypothetical protein
VTTLDGAWSGSRPLGESLLGELIWSRPRALRRDLVLEAGSEQLALLRWEKLFSLQATAICADRRWIIGRQGAVALKSQIVMREAKSDQAVATFERSWRGAGVLRLAGGAEYRWQRTGVWRGTWSWSSALQERLVAFKSRHGVRTKIEMEVDPSARELDEVPVLVLLGAYIMAVLVARRGAR